MAITVYSKPHCPQCDATYRMLAKFDLEYEVVDVSADAGAFEYVTSLGHSSAPVVVVGEESWSGFRPDKIKATATAMSRALAAA